MRALLNFKTIFDLLEALSTNLEGQRKKIKVLLLFPDQLYLQTIEKVPVDAFGNNPYEKYS